MIVHVIITDFSQAPTLSGMGYLITYSFLKNLAQIKDVKTEYVNWSKDI